MGQLPKFNTENEDHMCRMKIFLDINKDELKKKVMYVYQMLKLLCHA